MIGNGLQLGEHLVANGIESLTAELQNNRAWLFLNRGVAPDEVVTEEKVERVRERFEHELIVGITEHRDDVSFARLDAIGRDHDARDANCCAGKQIGAGGRLNLDACVAGVLELANEFFSRH